MRGHSGYQEPASSFEFGVSGTHCRFLHHTRSFPAVLSNADIRNRDSGYQELKFGVSGTKGKVFPIYLNALQNIIYGITLNQTHINTTPFK